MGFVQVKLYVSLSDNKENKITQNDNDGDPNAPTFIAQITTYYWRYKLISYELFSSSNIL